MTRNEFREGVFARDGHECVLCGDPAQDAHHILERRLWTDGGYYLDNGASVCGPCHVSCEETTISCDTLRDAIGVKKPLLPDHLYYDQQYDKWGNPILNNGNRLKGDLFNDESVQKILRQGGVLHLFTHWVKYPRTFHLPWSPGLLNDDRMHQTTSQWEGKEVIVGIKMDGENTSMYQDHIHARSIDSGSHPSRDRIKAMWAQFSGDIPEGWRICAENVYAKHSIHYKNLTSYLIGFGVWNDKNICLSWDESLEWFELLGIEPNETIYEGIYDEKIIRGLEDKLDFERDEGYVMRLRDAFHYNDFRKYVGKYVRAQHIQSTVHHWKAQKIVPNLLKK